LTPPFKIDTLRVLVAILTRPVATNLAYFMHRGSLFVGEE